MLFGSNPYCSASRFFTALNASKKSWGNHSETHVNDKIKWNEITHVISCHLFLRKEKPKTTSLRSGNSPPGELTTNRLGRVSLISTTEVRELQSSGWRNGQIIHESQFTHRVIFEGHDLQLKMNFSQIQKWKTALIMRFALQCCWSAFWMCFWSFNVGWSPQVTALEDSSQYSPPFSYNSEASQQGLSNRPSRWRT